MDPFNPLVAVALIAIALICARLLPHERLAMTTGNQRFAAIDGLRGYLAMGVFIHHSAIWWGYAREGRWEAQPSVFFTQIGASSVYVFFMVTAFLFGSRLAAPRRIDWLDLYVSRLLRLFPLYAAVMCACFAITAFKTGWALHVPPMQLVTGAFKWLAFRIPGSPDLNGFAEFSTLTANATWTLRFEWLFYFLLPVMGVIAARGKGLVAIVLGALVGGWLASGLSVPNTYASFGVGLGAAFLNRRQLISPRFAKSHVASLAVGVCVVFAMFTPVALVSLGALAIAFILVCSGNDLFGILSWRSSQALGELTYSVYLLHGLLLYVAFDLVLGRDFAAHLSVPTYWSVLAVLCVLLMIASTLTFRWIERPSMGARKRLVALLRGGRRPLANDAGSNSAAP